MNTDYIISGKGQSAIMGANWNNARASAAVNTVDDDTPIAADDHADSATEITSVGSARNRGPAVQSANMSFDDFVDIINPLQHIPGLNLAYRAVTGDKISGFAEIAGGMLYGGIAGLVSGVANAIVQDQTGDDIGNTMIAAVFGEDENNSKEPVPGEASDTMVAANDDNASDKTVAAGAAPAAAPQTPVEAQALEAKPAIVQIKQPFGGVMGTKVAGAAEGAPSIGDTPIGDVVATGNKKYFPVAGVVRRGGGETPRMPIKDSPDVRLKSINNIARANSAAAMNALADAAPIKPKPAINPLEAAANATLLPDVPLISKTEADKVLGLDNEMPATRQALAPGLAAGMGANGNPLPPELIEDMMKMAIDKYQKGQQNGTLPAVTVPGVDIKG